ncbi:tetratricopeptide repeat protein [Brevundimonas kwangchunensis]|uniref:Tetratricopeptide repeat protein n=1 Tax=Brevundimonas kwangchunensis TaxID=322163 RepID=A0ABN1GDM0_9CAUL
MRHASLRLVLSASAALIALPALAQEAPVIVDPAPRDDAPAVIIEDPNAPPAALPSEVPTEEPVAEPEPAAPPIPAVWAPVPTDAAGNSAYGLYLAGRVAAIRGDRAEAARLLTESQALTPEQPALGDHAFREGLFAGDLDEVVRLTPTVQETPLLAETGRIIGVVQTFARGDGRGALALLQSQSFAPPFAHIARYITPSVALAAGNDAIALAPVQAAQSGAETLILKLARARALETRRRYDDADDEYKSLMAMPGGVQLFGVDYGEFLERRRRRDEAITLYQQALSGQAAEIRLVTALQRAQSNGRPPALPTPQQTAADALQFASVWTSHDEAYELSVIYLRMAESLAPGDLVSLRLGHALAAAEQNSAARNVFARISMTDPVLYAGAQFNLAQSWQRDENGEQAAEALRRADAAVPGQLMVMHALAGQLIALDRNQDALEILNRPTMNTADQPGPVRFLRGAALERLGRIEEAENELWTALQASPEDPVMLNHLGYLWVDSGRRVEQGAEMIARAHAADPENGNIQDSLGWAQFRQGQYETAVETLEGAVAKEPANAEIVDHLGDAYWQVGRRREAEWQWSRVLTLEPEPERRAEVQQKLQEGLTIEAPVTGARP